MASPAWARNPQSAALSLPENSQLDSMTPSTAPVLPPAVPAAVPIGPAASTSGTAAEPSDKSAIDNSSAELAAAESSLVWWACWFPALRHPPFRAFIAGHAVSVIGTWMQSAAQGWYVQELTRSIGSEYWLGLTSAAASLPVMLFALVGGTLADRLPRRPVLVATQVSAMMLALTLGILVACGWAPLWLVILFSAATGLVMAFDIPTRQAFAVELVGKRDLLSGISLNSAVFNLGRLLGPALAGLVLVGVGQWFQGQGWDRSSRLSPDLTQGELWGIATCLLINALTFSGVVWALWWMRLPDRPKATVVMLDSGKRPAALLVGLLTVLRTPRLLGLIGTLALVLTVSGSYVALLPALAGNRLQVGETGFALMLSANGLGALLAALLVASSGTPSQRENLVLIGLALMGCGLLGVSVSDQLLPTCLALAVTGGGFVFYVSCSNSAVQLAVADEIRGRVMSVWVLTFGAAQPLGSLLAGYLAHLWSTPIVLGLGGGFCLLAIPLAGWVLRFPIPAERSEPDISVNS